MKQNILYQNAGLFGHHAATAAKATLLSSLLLLQACGGGGGSSDAGNLADQNVIAADTSSEPAGFSAANTSNPDTTCQMTVLDGEILDAVNAIRAQPRQCGDRSFNATNTVSWSCSLKSASAVHSQDMGGNNFFAHPGSDGLRVNARVDATGYAWVKVGENIAAGYNTTNDVMQAWLDSPDHCATLMDPDYQQLGAAIDLPTGADYSVYWTLIMAKPTE